MDGRRASCTLKRVPRSRGECVLTESTRPQSREAVVSTRAKPHISAGEIVRALLLDTSWWHIRRTCYSRPTRAHAHPLTRSHAHTTRSTRRPTHLPAHLPRKQMRQPPVSVRSSGLHAHTALSHWPEARTTSERDQRRRARGCSPGLVLARCRGTCPLGYGHRQVNSTATNAHYCSCSAHAHYCSAQPCHAVRPAHAVARRIHVCICRWVRATSCPRPRRAMSPASTQRVERRQPT